MTPDQVAGRALQHVGTPFRLYGRDPQFALDCVGLVAASINADGAWTYRLKGNYRQTIATALCERGFDLCDGDTTSQSGDIALVQISPQQQHLMIRASNGWVHAHAGIGRVVHTPGPAPWPIIALWRLTWQP